MNNANSSRPRNGPPSAKKQSSTQRAIARALWNDESIIHNGILILGRRDGIVIQSIGAGEMEGYNDPDESPNLPSAHSAVNSIRILYQRIKTTPTL